MNLLQFAALCLTSGLVVVFAVVASLFSRRTANVILAGGITVAALLLCTCTCFMFVLRDLHFVSCTILAPRLAFAFLLSIGCSISKKKGGVACPVFQPWIGLALHLHATSIRFNLTLSHARQRAEQCEPSWCTSSGTQIDLDFSWTLTMCHFLYWQSLLRSSRYFSGHRSLSGQQICSTSILMTGS